MTTETRLERGRGMLNRFDGQISLTDPDARAMATSARHSGMVGYNVQSAVDTETHIIVTHEVTNQGFDRDQPSPMATTANEALGRDDLHAIADKGYFSGAEIRTCHEQGITTTVPRPATSGNEGKGMFVKADFLYDPERDAYRCPAGNELMRRCATSRSASAIARSAWPESPRGSSPPPLQGRHPSPSIR
jgi:hypothetical protein